MITWEIKIINQKFSINFIKKDKTNKLNKFLFYLLQIYHFFDSFLVFFGTFSIETCQFIHSRSVFDSIFHFSIS